MDETLRNPSIEPIRVSVSSMNQMRNEKDETIRALRCSPRNRNREQSIFRTQNQRCVDDRANQVKEEDFPWKTYSQNERNKFIRFTVWEACSLLHDRGTTKATNSTKLNEPTRPIEVYQDYKITHVFFKLRRENQLAIRYWYRRSYLSANWCKIDDDKSRRRCDQWE